MLGSKDQEERGQVAADDIDGRQHWGHGIGPSAAPQQAGQAPLTSPQLSGQIDSTAMIDSLPVGHVSSSRVWRSAMLQRQLAQHQDLGRPPKAQSRRTGHLREGGQATGSAAAAAAAAGAPLPLPGRRSGRATKRSLLLKDCIDTDLVCRTLDTAQSQSAEVGESYEHPQAPQAGPEYLAAPHHASWTGLDWLAAAAAAAEAAATRLPAAAAPKLPAAAARKPPAVKVPGGGATGHVRTVSDGKLASGAAANSTISPHLLCASSIAGAPSFEQLEGPQHGLTADAFVYQGKPHYLSLAKGVLGSSPVVNCLPAATAAPAAGKGGNCSTKHRASWKEAAGDFSPEEDRQAAREAERKALREAALARATEAAGNSSSAAAAGCDAAAAAAAAAAAVGYFSAAESALQRPIFSVTGKVSVMQPEPAIQPSLAAPGAMSAVAPAFTAAAAAAAPATAAAAPAAAPALPDPVGRISASEEWLKEHISEQPSALGAFRANYEVLRESGLFEVYRAPEKPHAHRATGAVDGVVLASIAAIGQHSVAAARDAIENVGEDGLQAALHDLQPLSLTFGDFVLKYRQKAAQGAVMLVEVWKHFRVAADSLGEWRQCDASDSKLSKRKLAHWPLASAESRQATMEVLMLAVARSTLAHHPDLPPGLQLFDEIDERDTLAARSTGVTDICDELKLAAAEGERICLP